jgi:hypothetical protein
MIDDAQVKDLLQRTSNDWHPFFPYWLDLCRNDLFYGITPRELEIQMVSLLWKFLLASSNETLVYPPIVGPPSQNFSPSQNRRLLCSAFGIRDVGVNPISRDDWAQVEDEILRSRIPDMVEPRNIKREVLDLSCILHLVHGNDGLVS